MTEGNSCWVNSSTNQMQEKIYVEEGCVFLTSQASLQSTEPDGMRRLQDQRRWVGVTNMSFVCSQSSEGTCTGYSCPGGDHAEESCWPSVWEAVPAGRGFHFTEAALLLTPYIILTHTQPVINSRTHIAFFVHVRLRHELPLHAMRFRRIIARSWWYSVNFHWFCLCSGWCWWRRHNEFWARRLQHISIYTQWQSLPFYWDPYAVRRGGCLDLYYCTMVEWFWWDSSLISTTNWFCSVLWHCWFGHMACKNRPWNDL